MVLSSKPLFSSTSNVCIVFCYLTFICHLCWRCLCSCQATVLAAFSVFICQFSLLFSVSLASECHSSLPLYWSMNSQYWPFSSCVKDFISWKKKQDVPKIRFRRKCVGGEAVSCFSIFFTLSAKCIQAVDRLHSFL